MQVKEKWKTDLIKIDNNNNIIDKGYNWEEDKPNMGPAMPFQWYIKTHIYEPT